MISAIAGDTIGSVYYKWKNIKTKQFDPFSPDCCFTDDTVLTVALGGASEGKNEVAYKQTRQAKKQSAPAQQANPASEPVQIESAGSLVEPKQVSMLRAFFAILDEWDCSEAEEKESKET